MQVLILAVISLGLVAALKKLVDFAAYVRAGHKNGIATQLLSWALGVVTAFVTTAQASIDHLTARGGVAVGSWNGLTKTLLGVALGSLASVVHDHFQAVDNTQSARTPPLVPPPTPPTATAVAQTYAAGNVTITGSMRPPASTTGTAVTP